jgi:hypothetical protein
MAEMPPPDRARGRFLLDVTSRIARNQRAGPVLLCSKMVPARIECCRPEAVHPSISRFL